jgi:hypothetical protein
MRRVQAGLIFLVAAALAFAAVLALNPAPANAQTADEAPDAKCGGSGFNFDVPTPPLIPNGQATSYTLVTNLKEKKVDVVIEINDLSDPTVGRDLAIFSKQPEVFQNVTLVDDLQEAITEINNVYNSNQPPRKLNVFISGHGLPGQAQVGTDVIGNQDSPLPFPVDTQRNNQQKFVNALRNHIDHLKFIECSTGYGDIGQAFLEKLASGLGAARVSAFTNKLRPWPKLTDASVVPGTMPPQTWAQFYQKHLTLAGFANQYTVDFTGGTQPGGKKEVTPGPIGGVSLDPQLPGSSGGDAGPLAGVVAGAAAVVVMTGGGVWYARRRRVR